ncbi:MAG: YdcF family protein, partial [Ilumatobacteraceae bacterium]
RLAATAAVVIVLALAYYGVTLYQVHATGRSDQARSVDAIVVMGAAQYDGRPSPQLAARLDHAAELWASGLAKVMVVTGGNQPGDRFTEAEASARYLIARGVPTSSILKESQGHSTYESLDTVATMLHQRGLFRILVVTDPFHSLRSRLIAQELGLVAYVSPTRTSPVRGQAAFSKELEEAAGIAVGRIISFKRLLSITG